MKKQNGITLISLIITIIIMLILAGVSLSMVMGDGSIIDQASSATEKTRGADVKEVVELAASSNKIGKYSGTGTKTKAEVIQELIDSNKLTAADQTALTTSDVLEIGGITIDFSIIDDSLADVPVTPAERLTITSYIIGEESYASRANVVVDTVLNVEKANPTEELTYTYRFYDLFTNGENYKDGSDLVITTAATTVTGSQTFSGWTGSGFGLVRLEVTDSSGNVVLTKSFNESYYGALEPGFYYTFGVACFPADTLVSVVVEEEDENGKKTKKLKKKKIKDLTYDDDLLVWDFDKGCLAITKPLWLMKKQETEEYNLLKFSDGTELKTVRQHRIFNKELGKFTYPMSDETPVGTTTFKEDGTEVTLVSKEVVKEPVEFYNLISNYHMNAFAEGILTSCRFSNLYEIKDMKYVKDDRELASKEDYADIPEEYFYGLRLAEQPKEINRGNDDSHASSLKEHIMNVYVSNQKV